VRRFVGLSLDETAPDHSTICRFRNAQVEKRLSEAEFPEAIRQIDLKGLILREGAMIDATCGFRRSAGETAKRPERR